MWFSRGISTSRSEHTTVGTGTAVETMAVRANGWKGASGIEAWSGPSSPGEWGPRQGAQLWTASPSSVMEAPGMAQNQDVVMPLMVGGARDPREESDAMVSVSPTPSRHLSKRLVGSPPPGELAGGRNYHASEIDGSTSGNGTSSPESDGRFSTISYDMLGREVYNNAR